MDIRERLVQLGAEVGEEDEAAVLFAENKTAEHIKNVCNLDYIPEELEYLAVDMACGEYLRDRLLSGVMGDFDTAGALKAITEGDVRVEYDGGDSLEALLEFLGRGEADLYRFRKICW